MRFLGISFCLAVIAPLAFAFQDGGSFRSNTRLVSINVVVRDKHGPVANLSKDDFAITDNGKPQVVKVFAMNSILNASQTANTLPRDTFTNGESGGTAPAAVTVILLDRLNTLSGTGSEAYEETQPGSRTTH
jgi:VWFA-related protein